MFRNREDAGCRLAARVAPLVAPQAVVAAVPRGGVAVALPIAQRIRIPLTVIYAQKLTAPADPELAFGALDEDGVTLIDHVIVSELGLGPDDIQRETHRVGGEIRRRMARYRVPPVAHHLPGAGVVLVDDGLATGLTMRAALVYARRHGAREITVAVPCASAQAAAWFEREADHFVALVVEAHFDAVGAYYADFSPVTDDAVQAMLTASMPSYAPELSLAIRLLPEPCLWCWEIREVDGKLVESSWASAWTAYESRQAAQEAGRRRLAELSARPSLHRRAS